MKNICTISIVVILLFLSISCKTTETIELKANNSAINEQNFITSTPNSNKKVYAIGELGKVRDQAIEKVVVEGFTKSDLSEIRYAYVKTDLNDDGFKDAIVSLRGSSICGSGGCQLEVLKGSSSGYSSLSQISPVQGGFAVLGSKSNGWRDLGVSIGGGGIESGDVILKFDGKAYPENPTVSGKPSHKKIGTEFMSEDDFEKYSFPLVVEQISNSTKSEKSGLTCSPSVLRQGDVLTISMKSPHGGFLEIITPKNEYVFLSEEDGDKLVKDAVNLGAEPYFSKSKLSSINELKIDTGRATTVDYKRGEVAGKLRLKPLFMSSGIYKIFLSNTSFEQDEPDIQGQCEVTFRPN